MRVSSAGQRDGDQSERGPVQAELVTSLLEVVLGPGLEPDLTEGEHNEETQVPRHQPQPATT
jgi:hypothetical protein